MVADVCERMRERERESSWWLWSMLYIGAAEMAQGLRSGAGSRKWRGAAAFQLFAPTQMGCFLLYHLYALSDFFPSKLIDSLERWHPREAFILAKLPSGLRQAIHPRQAFLFIAITLSICPLEASRGKQPGETNSLERYPPEAFSPSVRLEGSLGWGIF